MLVKGGTASSQYVTKTQMIWWSVSVSCTWNINFLTHYFLDKIAAISQTILSNVFSWIKSFVFWLTFDWILFLRVQLTMLDNGLAPNRRRQAIIGTNADPVHLHIYATLREEELIIQWKQFPPLFTLSIIETAGNWYGLGRKLRHYSLNLLRIQRENDYWWFKSLHIRVVITI